jgi:vitamin B12 transporter
MNAQPLDKLNINLNWLMVRDRIDSDGSDMDDYWTTNLVARYSISKLISVYARSENMFDYEYEEVTGFNSLGRTIYGGVDLEF